MTAATTMPSEAAKDQERHVFGRPADGDLAPLGAGRLSGAAGLGIVAGGSVGFEGRHG